MRSASFWNIVQHTVVIPYRRFATTLSVPISRVLDFLNLENGTNGLSSKCQ